MFDFDDDGDPDLFQGNDHQENFLFLNDGAGRFRDVGRVSGVAVNDQGFPTGSMHGSIGDVDGDGLIDLFVTDLRHGSLYRNVGEGLFVDVTRESGVAGPFQGKGAWAAALFDFDNDGDLDIFSANGVAEELIDQYPLLLRNDGTGRFDDIGAELAPYFGAKRSGRGAAVWDYDDDGDLDIIVSHIDLKGTVTLLRNDGGNTNHWLGLTLVGTGGPASAIGARVVVEAGGRRQVLVNQWATSYLSHHDPRLHIGLGRHASVDRLEIRWPDGTLEVLRDVRADRYVTIVQGEGDRRR